MSNEEKIDSKSYESYLNLVPQPGLEPRVAT